MEKHILNPRTAVSTLHICVTAMQSFHHLKSGWLAPLLLFFVFWSQAQPVDFKGLTVQEALQQAAQTDRFVMIYVYATWSQPCHHMEQQVFALDTVGFFFNQHFISLRLDTEKQQLKFIESQEVETYPTLIFYDPKGRRILKQEGILEAEDLLSLGHSLVHLSQYHEAYERKQTMENVHRYTLSLKWVNQKKAATIAKKYLTDLKPSKYTSLENWELIREFVKPWDRMLFSRILENEGLIEDRFDSYQRFVNAAMKDLLEAALY